MGFRYFYVGLSSFFFVEILLNFIFKNILNFFLKIIKMSCMFGNSIVYFINCICIVKGIFIVIFSIIVIFKCGCFIFFEYFLILDCYM